MGNFLGKVLIVTFFILQLGIMVNAQTDSNKSISNEINFKGCPANPDKLYDRREILEQFASILHNSIPALKGFIKDESAYRFFVWDITDPSNRDAAFLSDCVNFVDNHIYHFAGEQFPFSISHIAVLENGKLKIFSSLNCPEGRDEFKELINYLEAKLTKDKNKNDILARVKNFRRYGYYSTTDQLYNYCKEGEDIPENPDKLYARWDMYIEFNKILRKFAPEFYKRQLGISIDRERAINFFVYDLTDPSNKQTTSIERVDFINNHVYHFAYLDAPYSYSHIAVLENGKLKVFNGINCANKGDSLEDVIKYLNEKLKNDKNKDEIIERVKNYRQYGVYTPFNGISTPQCQELKINEK